MFKGKKGVMKMEKKNFISLTESNILKGVALIFMYIHHMFTIPQWYIDGISYPKLIYYTDIFRNPFNPVPIFCFITGYTYVFSKNKTLKQSLKKIFKILIPFWVVMIAFMIIGILTNTYDFSIDSFILECFGLEKQIMFFCWYIYFYIIVMVTMPFISKVSEKMNVTQNVLVLLFIPIIIFYALKGIFFNNDIIVSVLNNLIIFYPTVIAGYLVSKYDVFNKLESINIKERYRLILCFFVLVSSFLLKYLVPYVGYGTISTRRHLFDLTMNLDIIYIPLFIYSFIKLARLFNAKLYIPLIKIGKLSMLMWFTHCLFFNCSKEIFMPILYAPGNAILVLIWAIILNYAMAFLFNIVTSRLVKLIK